MEEITIPIDDKKTLKEVIEHMKNKGRCYLKTVNGKIVIKGEK